MFSQGCVTSTLGGGDTRCIMGWVTWSRGEVVCMWGVDITSPLDRTTTPLQDRTTTSPWPGSKVTTPPPTSGHYAQAGGTPHTGMYSCFRDFLQRQGNHGPYSTFSQTRGIGNNVHDTIFLFPYICGCLYFLHHKMLNVIK